MIVGAEHKAIRSLDGQLIRLGSRLFGAAIAIGCLIQGADQLGFPAYSVLAGLGVGGLAVALAAKDSIANLLGSMMIMLEKPFRVGHHIRLAGTEGTVEDVGFRSTRIRTPDNSLISIPNKFGDQHKGRKSKSAFAAASAVCRWRYLRHPADSTAIFRCRDKAACHRPWACGPNRRPCTSFNAFSDSSLDILVRFHLAVTNSPSELRGREEILVAIMELAERLDVAFAFPTRTVIVEQASSVEAGTSSVSSRFLAAAR